MRRARIKVAAEEGEAVYHLISRTVNGEWMLKAAVAKEVRVRCWGARHLSPPNWQRTASGPVGENI